MSNVKPSFLAMTEIMPLVDSIIAQDTVPQWGTINHVSLVAKLARKAIDTAIDLALDETEQHLFVCRTLNQHGIAGNASQFRQYLSSDKGGKRIPEGLATTATYK